MNCTKVNTAHANLLTTAALHTHCIRMVPLSVAYCLLKDLTQPLTYNDQLQLACSQMVYIFFPSSSHLTNKNQRTLICH